MPPRVRVFISPDEVYRDRSVTYEEVSDLAAALNRPAALRILGNINLILSAATSESRLYGRHEPVRAVQTWLLREIISEELLRDLKSQFRNQSLLDRPILHRTQVLFAIRLVATHGQSTGGNTLASRRELDSIGDLLFLINGLFKVRFEGKGRPNTALSVATQMGPPFELENPTDITLSWPRTEQLLEKYLPGSFDNPNELRKLEQIALFGTGLNLREVLDLTMMLFFYWNSLSCEELLKNIDRAYLDPRGDHEIISAAMLAKAVEHLAVPFDDLERLLRIDHFTWNTLFDLTPFRTKPLWVMPNGLVTCVDAPLLMDRLGPHYYWSLVNVLDTKERRRDFSGKWGRAFERYCLDGLGQIFRSKKWSFLENPHEGEELWDAIAWRDSTAIVFECKGTFIRSDDKYSGTPRRFLRGLNRKFGNVRHGATFQLLRGIDAAWFQGKPLKSLDIPTAISEVFPVLIHQEPLLECGPVSRVLSDRFNAHLARTMRSRRGKLPKVWPLAVTSADDLDLLRAGIETSGVRLDSVLKRFHRKNPSRMFSLGDFLSSGKAADFGFTESGPDAIRLRFVQNTRGPMERFKDKLYV